MIFKGVHEADIFFYVFKYVSVLHGFYLLQTDNLIIIIVPLFPTRPFLHTAAPCHVFCHLKQPFHFSLQTSLYITQMWV